MSHFLLVEAQGAELLSFILPPSEATGNTTMRYEHGATSDEASTDDVIRRARFHSLPIVLGRGLNHSTQNRLAIAAYSDKIVVLNDW